MSDERKARMESPHAEACGACDERTPAVQPTRGGMSRREFARRAAVASAVASLAPAGAVGARLTSDRASAANTSTQAPSTPPATSSPQTPPPASAQQIALNLPKLSSESQAEVDARLQAILGRYGARFTDDQKTDLRRLCTVVQPSLDRLRAYAVENGEGPGLYLKPLVEREKKPAAAPRPSSTAASPSPKTPAPAAGGAAKKP